MSLKIMFHHITGSSIKLSEDKLSAYRKKPFEEFENGWLFSATQLNSNDEFQIQILHLISSQYESLQIGLTSENPVDLKNTGLLTQNQIFKNSWMLHDDKFYYQNDDNIITSEEYDINLSELQEGDLIGVNINEKRELCFTHNGIPFRTVAEEIPQNVWAFVNLCGNCSFITIIPLESPITRSQKNKMIPKLNQISKTIIPIEAGEVNFHSYCGKEVRLSSNNRIAQRKNPTNEFRNAVVISNTSLIMDQIFKLRIEGLINKWNGSIEFGVTIHNPDSFELPATMTNLRSGTLVLSGNSILTNGHGNQLPYSPISLDDLKIGDEIGVRRSSNGDINFFINDNDLGIAGNIPTEMEIWAIIDLYGRTIKVAIPDNKPKSPILNLETIFSDSNDKLLFHSNCGKNINISQDGCNASRINDQEFNNGIVFSNRPLHIGDIWIIKLVRCVDQWAGNLEIGVTTMVPGECDLPSTMTDLNTGYTVMLTSNGLVVNGCPLSQIEHSMDLETVHSVLLTGISSLIENYTLGIALIDQSKLQFFLNNADLGIVTLEEGSNELYGVIDLYGKAAEVSISFKESCNRTFYKIDKQFNPNDLSFDEIKLITENLKDDNDDVNRFLDPINSDNGLNEMLIDADRSFLRLLTNEETFTNETQTSERSQMRFHEIHGRNVILTEAGRTAYRPSPNNEFKNALVMSSRPLATDELFEICVEKMTDHWSGSLEIGVTLIKPDELNFPGTLSQLDRDCWILSGSCLMNNGITARNDYRLDMDNIQVNSRIGVVRRQNGMLHFLLDDEDMGPAYFNVPFGIYVILDLYGQCSQVSITNKTGIKLLDATDNVDENSVREFLNISPRIQNEYFSPRDVELTLPSMFSVLERTMFALKKNLSNSSENLGSFKFNKLEDENKIISNDSKNSLVAEEKIIEAKSLFYESIFGTGITADGIGNFYTHKQNLNCVIQFSHPLKSNFYYELLFWNNKNHGYNIDPISFGIISEKFSSEILPDNLSSIKSPNWIIRGGRLFVNNKLRCQNFAPSLTRYKKNVLVGLYFYDNSNLEIYVDHISIGKVVSEIQEDCYLTINLRGWFNTLISLGMSSKPNYSLSQSCINWKIPNHPLNEYQTDFPTDNKGDGLLLDYHQLSNSDNNLNIEDQLIVLIVKELSQLLPSFFIIMHGIDSSRLTEKVVNRNNDIVLCVRKKLLSNYSISQFINKFNCKADIQNYLIEELSNRFSHLPELKHLGNSTFEIARTLRRRYICEKIPYDEKKSAFIIPNCSINLEMPKISRSKSGSDFGLCILNQELMSKKFSSYEIQIVQNDSRINTDSNNDLNTLIMGLILIEKNHFPNSEDIFRFFMNIPCPRRINQFHNTITHHLELQNFESKAAVLIIENDCVYVNEKKICQYLPFNMKNISHEDYLSFALVEKDLEIADIYLSIRNNDLITNHKVFTESWLKSPNNIKTLTSTKNIYYYIPFVWLQNQCEVTVTTKGKTKSISICEIQNTDEQDWLEKHYNDGLNKESFHSGINSDLILNQKDRKCISVSRSNEIKKSLALPDVYFHNHLADCYCNNCYYSINGTIIDPTKDFRLPFGWVKYNTRFIKDDRFNLSQWKVAYLTVSHGLLYRLLSTNNPINILKNNDSSNSTQVTWLKLSNSDIPCNKTIVVSPWQPLIGCYLNEDDSIAQCADGMISYFDPLTFSKDMAKIALEVKVKPATFKNLECKIINENQYEIKRITPKEIDGDGSKKSIDFNISRPINQKTVWILNGDEYSLVITGLLMKI